MALDCRPPSPLFVIMLLDFSARVLLVGLKAPLDRLRPDDSILAAIRIFGCFDNEVVGNALERLVNRARSWC